LPGIKETRVRENSKVRLDIKAPLDGWVQLSQIYLNDSSSIASSMGTIEVVTQVWYSLTEGEQEAYSAMGY
jgi:hypothetical protein